MSEQVIIAVMTLLGTGLVALVALRGWQGWLAVKSRELELRRAIPEGGSTEGATRIELADLKERVRQLEAIANGVEL